MRKITAVLLCSAMLAGSSLSVFAASAGTETATNTSNETAAATGETPAMAMGAEAAKETIGDAFGNREFGEQIVASAQSKQLTDAQTKAAVEQIGDIDHEGKKTEEKAAYGAYHLSGATLLEEQIAGNAAQIEKVMIAKGEKTVLDNGTAVYAMEDVEATNASKWRVVYTESAHDLAFSYQINGNNCCGAVVLHYNTALQATTSVDVAYYGTLSDGVSYVADFRAPFNKKLHTKLDELNYSAVYSNLTNKYDKEFAEDCNDLAESAMKLWQEKLQKQSSIGFGELGFGAFEVHGFVKNTDGSWWYMNADGTMPVSSWLNADGKWYHFDQNAKMQTGWYEENGKQYYLGADGAMVTGEQTIEGKNYRFNEKSGELME